MSVNRYKRLISNGSYKRLPLVNISKRSTDYYEIYKKNGESLDNLSYKYYNDPNYVWLIMMANQEYGSMEYSIPDGVTLRIPFPLDDVLSEYDLSVGALMTKYGYA